MTNPWLKKSPFAARGRSTGAVRSQGPAQTAQTALVVAEIFRFWLSGARPSGARGGRRKA